jgi:signal transduction histidine kinase
MSAEAAYRGALAKTAQRRVGAICGLFAVFMLVLFLTYDRILFSPHPRAIWLHFFHALMCFVTWLWLRRPRSLRQLSRFILVAWGVGVVLTNLPVYYVRGDIMPQMLAGHLVSMMVLVPLTRLPWRTCAILLVWDEVTALLALVLRFPDGLPAFVVPMAPLPLATAGTIYLIARFHKTDRERFFEREALLESNRRLAQATNERVEAALREQSAQLMMELHDGVKGTLSRAAVLLHSERDGALGTPGHRILAAQSAVREAIEESAAMLQALDATPEPWDAMVADLRAAMRSACSDGGLELEFVVERAGERVPPAVAHALRRIAREAMTNIVRHAGARKVSCRLHIDDGVVRLRVHDDGRGLGGRAVGRGLGIIARRATQLGGSSHVADDPAGGAVVSVELPLSQIAPRPPISPGAASG